MRSLIVIEAAGLALALSSIVWVLGIQAIGLLRSMPRARFLSLQMQLVRVWARALAVITAVVATAATLRGGLEAWPAVAGAVAAAVSSGLAVPRALRAGAESIRADTNEVSAGSFLVEGGGGATRLWHRVVLACVAVVVVGLSAEGSRLLSALLP